MSVEIVLVPAVVSLNGLTQGNCAAGLVIIVDGCAFAEHSDESHDSVVVLVAVTVRDRGVSGGTWIERNDDRLRGVALPREALILQVAGGHAGRRE